MRTRSNEGVRSRLPGATALAATIVLVVAVVPASATCHTVSFDPAEYQVAEDDGNVLLTVVNPGPGVGDRTIDYRTVDGTATAGADFVARSGTLSFSATQNNRTISVAITDDGAYEGAETFTVALAMREGSCISKPGRPAVVTIVDDDPQPPSPSRTTTSAGTAGAKPKVVPTTSVSARAAPSKPARAATSSPSPTPDDYTPMPLAGAQDTGVFDGVDGWNLTVALLLGGATGVWVWRRFAP